MTKKTLIYARVSTDEQAEKGYSLQTQIDACRTQAAQQGHMIPNEDIYTDDYSGATLDRPGMFRLRASLKKGDSVIVYDPDRLSRDDVDFLVICREWERLGVSLLFVNGGEVPNTPEGDIVRYLMGWKGKRERKAIIKRTQRGKRAKAASGKWVGNTHPPYGYRKIGRLRESSLEVNELEAMVVKRIYAEFVQGLRLQTVADGLTRDGIASPGRGTQGKKWYVSAVKSILRSRVYLGEITNYGQQIVLSHLAIIDSETWGAAQKRRSHHRTAYPNQKKRDYLLSGYITCTCGQRMYGVLRKPRKREYYYYNCYSAMHCFGCHESVISLPKVDLIVWSWLDTILRDDEKREKGIRKLQKQRQSETAPTLERLTAIAALLRKADRKIERLAQGFANAKDDVVAAALDGQMNLAAQEHKNLLAEKGELEALLTQRTISEDKIKEVRRIAAAIRRRLPIEPTFEQKRMLLDLLSVQITLLQKEDSTARKIRIQCEIREWEFVANLDYSRTAIA